jgi:ACS family tartrate transporter-like MFS transporter
MSINELTDQKVLKKVAWRLLPLVMLLFFMSLLDRTNISFAALEMNKDLGLSLAQFGIAASVFYVGYFLFEIPSNFAQARLGARIWLTRIMVTWGAVVVANGFVGGATSLYVVRFLLGVAEAGLLPGLLFYLGLWMPAQQRGATYATLLATTAIAYALGGPFTTWLMTFSASGLKGWQTMYVVQGLLTIIVGAAIPFLLPSYVSDAKWLSPDERAWLQAKLDAEEEQKKLVGATTVRQGFLDPRIMLTTLTCFFLVCANFGTVLFLPQILKPIFSSLTNIELSLMISLAFAIGGVGGIVAGRHSDHTGDRKWHLVVSTIIAVVGYGYAAIAPTPLVQFISICVGVLGIWSTFGVFWAYAGDLLGGAAAPGGLAFVNSLGTLGGVVAPNLLAYAREVYGSFSGSLLLLAGFALVASIVAALLRPFNASTSTVSGVVRNTSALHPPPSVNRSRSG